ncbi:MAG TPA: hypothetical protein VG222_10705, partial [Vicinamibacterales bacterium]|nr:hypothetical protein [Vicinamibacterales bacterium]
MDVNALQPWQPRGGWPASSGAGPMRAWGSGWKAAVTWGVRVMSVVVRHFRTLVMAMMFATLVE